MHRRRSFAPLALPTLVWAVALLAGCGGEPPADALRLLHPPLPAATPAPAAGAVRLVSVEGPALPEEAEALHEAPGVAPVPAPGRLAEVVLADDRISDQRLALVAAAGTRYRYRLDLAAAPRRPLLRLAVAAFPGAAPAAPTAEIARGVGDAGGATAAAADVPAEPARLVFRVSVEPLGEEGRAGTAEELYRSVVSSGDGELWRPLELDLAPFAGGPVELVLATEAAPGESAPAALGGWALPEVVAAGEREAGWDVVFISLDTLRADHLGAYGYHRPTSPHLDAFAARGVRFAAAVAQSPWTRPSHQSMLNGLYPASHGPLASPMLAEVLRHAGWRTGAITGSGQVDASFGFDAGMDRYAVGDWIAEPELVLDWLEEGDGRRQFLFLHTYKIHDPYEEHDFTDGLPRGRIGQSFADADHRRLGKRLTDEEKVYVEALYDGGIADADRQLGRLFAALDERGVLERAIVVVTSDHGEQFWEHGSWRHGQNLYDHQLMVPLLVHLPPALAEEIAGRGGLAGRVIEEQVELLDLYPTLLELLGVPLEHRVQGASLLPLLAGDADAWAGGDAFAENTNVRTFEKKGFRTRRFKFVKSIPRQAARREGHDEPFYELYDLRRDPAEQENVAERHPDLVAALEERLQVLRRGGGGTLAEELPEGLDPELEERLRALGYLGE